MAESRNKVKTVGAPFDTTYSSCSNLKPKQFEWSSDQGEIVVHIDRGMFLLPNPSIKKEKTFGWVCESRFIVPDVYHFLIQNYKVLFENYYNKIFTCDHSLISLHKQFIYCHSGSNYPWVSRDHWNIYNKTKLCNMFCSPKLRTQDHHYRHKVARIVLDNGMDVFGGAHGTQRTVIDHTNPWLTKINDLKDYAFSIVMENGIYDSYWTEKLTDCFATGTIPVYWGTKQLPKEIDQTGIIRLEEGKEQEILDSLTFEKYKEMLPGVKNNYEFVNNLQPADDMIYDLIKG